MRRDCLFRLILMLLSFSALSYGQVWSGILDPSRAIDWSHAGLPSTLTYGTGGSACNGVLTNCVETISNPWTPPTRVKSGSTVTCTDTSSDAATINGAIAAAKPGSYVLIGPGTCNITSNVTFYNGSSSTYKGVTLRGSGPQSTILNFSGTNTKIQFGVGFVGLASGALSAASYSPKTTSVTITGVGDGSNLMIGNVAWFNQCDTGYSGSGQTNGAANCTSGSIADNFGIWVCGIDYPQCTFDTASSGTHNYQKQNVTITGVTNNGGGSYTVTFTPGLYMPNWSSGNNAQLLWQNSAYWSYGNGVEDMTVNFTSGINEKTEVTDAYAAWVKGVRQTGWGTPTLNIASVHSLYANNYFFGNTYDSLFAAIGEPILRIGDSDNLIVNNIITQGACVWANGGNTGDVIANNYCRDTQTNFYMSVSLNHEPYESFLLTEGNQFAQLHDDDTHGTHDLNTYFRNYTPGWDEPYITMNPWAFDIDPYQRFDNIIGNAIGGTLSTAYQGTSNSVGNEYVIPTADPVSVASLMRWGNCDVITAGCRFVSSEVPTNLSTWPNAVPFQNAVPSNHDLPASLFLGSSAPGWWKTCANWSTFPTSCANTQTPPFPANGPDVTGGSYVNGHANDIPAALAYKYLPIDTTLQNSFPITASSWSNSPSACATQAGFGAAPCEILTVNLSSINNGSALHIMGGFQLSGVNSACIPSGLPPNGEILMTGSTTTTIVYSLASSPNVSCTGMLLFPDIRQFDQRVYGNNSGGTSTLNPPSGLVAVVQ